MTHGGVKLAGEFSKLPSFEVFAWDIYHTLNQEQKEYLDENSVKLVDEDFLKENSTFLKDNSDSNLLTTAPIHCKVERPVDMSHHEAVAYLMKNHIDVPVIEITGVKGKTSVAYMLREIFKDLKPLTLSSLGVEVLEDGKWKQLKKDISITPASIITAWKLGQKYNPGIFIVETSLGGTGLGRVGILTNIVEDYPIASDTSSASAAKAQIFKDDLVVCDFESQEKFYREFKEKINCFSLNKGNVKASNIKLGLQKTVFNVEVQGLKTASGEIIEDNFEIRTFAPAPHHITNVLSAICASLTCGISISAIKKGLGNFHGLKGRTSLKYWEETCIIEEINPGINVTTVKRAIEMIENLPKSILIFGGKYGVTCEEIDENTVSAVLDELNEHVSLILTDDLGAELKKTVKRRYKFIKNLSEAVNYAQRRKYHHILLIYRSNFADLSYR